VSTREVDRHLAALDEPKRGRLEGLRASILEVVPQAEQGISYADDVARYDTSKGALRFAVDKPLPKRLVKKLITTRMRELGLA
jgi:uncharacterized protein YdhG (YjbR/CyaY superfamily)